MYKFFLLVCLCAQTVFVNAQVQPFNPSETEYLWPTNASKLASASFGETRSSHFHAAIDVKTWGRSGFELYATRDAILSRIARSPFGYGNVIYLKHRDGSFSVYAHMDRFTKKIDRLVDSLRWEKRVFVFDQNMEAFNIKYKKGELIGFSGSSGAGPAHIHFELRTPTESPFNPLLTSIKIKDTRAPQFSSIAIEPLSIDAKVETQKKVFIKKVRSVGRNYDFGTIDTQGEIGIAVDAFDQADGAANVLAVYELKLKVNNEILFHSRIDSFSYNVTRQMFLDRVYSILKSSNRGFQRLYRHDGNELSFYLKADAKAKLKLPIGLHAIEIEAADFYGNTTTLFGKIRVNQVEELAKETSYNFVKPSSVTVKMYPYSFNEWDWQNNWVRPTGNKQTTYLLEMRTIEFGQMSRRFEINEKKDQAVDLKKSGSAYLKFQDHEILLHRINPGIKTQIQSEDQLMKVDFSKNTVFDTLSLAAGHVFNDSLGYEMVYVIPEQEPLKSSFTIQLTLPNSYSIPSKSSFYKYNYRTDKVDYAFSTNNGRTIKANLRDFGIYRILTDTTAPEVYNPKMYRKSDGRWVVSVKGKDDLSGIDYNKSKFFVNDEEGILEYDPEEDIIVYYHPTFKPKKRNEIQLKIYDFEGNKTEQTFILSR